MDVILQVTSTEGTDFPQTAPKVTEFAVKTFGRLDGIVINHAVIGPIKRLANSSIEEWTQVYNANLFSALALVSL
jgi:NAD(P)-dependent dehydrogenase (short-subunit alcohol dehydrogenase family)